MKKSHLLSVLCAVAFSFSAETWGFSFFPTPTAWNPGADTARVGGFPAPGGATWSIMGAGISDVSGFDPHSSSTTSITALPGLSGLVTLADIETVMSDAIDIWADVSGFTNLGQVADSGAGFGATDAAGGNVGDIRIGAIFIDGPGAQLGHAYQPGTNDVFGVGGNITGDIHFDNSESWFISDLDGTGSVGTASGGLDLLAVAIHMTGHSLGLGHSEAIGSVMEAINAGVRTTLHADDVAGIQAIYGVATVPVPAAVWLFGSGLLGLIGIARRKKAA